MSAPAAPSRNLRPVMRLAACAAIAFATTGCAVYDPSPSRVPDGATPMSGAELAQLFATPVSLKDAFPGNDGFRHEVRPDGKWTVKTGLIIDVPGRWRIDGDSLCVTLRMREDCARAHRIDAQRIYMAFPGWSLEHSTFTIGK